MKICLKSNSLTVSEILVILINNEYKGSSSSMNCKRRFVKQRVVKKQTFPVSLSEHQNNFVSSLHSQHDATDNVIVLLHTFPHTYIGLCINIHDILSKSLSKQNNMDQE